jgi:ribosome biogenesis GTPase / thiamine phosphate phosphatase
MQATVYKSTGSWYVVKNDEGQQMNARIRGSFRKEGITSTNPIAVGDRVTIEMENELEQTVMITAIEDRRNYITRSSPHNRHMHHIVASNLDQSLLFVTLRDPKTSQGFMDRFLVACEAYHVPPIIVFNKCDLYKDKEQAQFADLKKTYEAMHYTVVQTSLVENIGVEELKNLLHNKTTLMSGHSGVGKSSFINSIFPQMELRTQEVSDWSGKGLHTTTFAEMFDLPFGGRIIDTPGVREFGLVDISKKELSQYYADMRAVLPNCQFNDCMHINEPGCAVKQAVNDGTIAVDRYVTYMNLLDTM